MKARLFFISVVFFVIACAGKGNLPDENRVEHHETDRRLIEEVIQELQAEKDSSKARLLVQSASLFMETPYVAHTLERDTEMLVVNVREVDCTTFAENSLAMANTLKSNDPSFNRFADELQQIRYHDGKIDGYTSRLHYFSDWIYENDRKGLVKDVSKEIAGTPYPNQVNFMSTHPDSYQQLKNNPALVLEIARQEKEISERSYYYIPEDTLAKVEHLLEDGDIAGITTNIEGLDMIHVVILVRKDGRIHPLHASSSAKKVIVSKETLEEYLKNSKSATGIMIARPL